MTQVRKFWREILVGVLLLSNILVWYAVSVETRDGILTVSFLDVGQGDAIFIDGPGGIQVLIDAGRGKVVLSQLGKVMPFYDRSIDVVVATHPDEDHVGGLGSVLDRFSVLMYLEPGVAKEKPTDIALGEQVSRMGIRKVEARAGMKIDLGSGAYLSIIFPDLDVSDFETNTASIVAILEYGKTKFILTGDSPIAIEEYLVGKLGSRLDVDVLKAGHHGSRTSSSEYFLAATSPTYVIISAGKDNSYGHPHREVLDKLTAIGAETINTATAGRVTITSDGSKLEIR